MSLKSNGEPGIKEYASNNWSNVTFRTPEEYAKVMETDFQINSKLVASI